MPRERLIARIVIVHRILAIEHDGVVSVEVRVRVTHHHRRVRHALIRLSGHIEGVALNHIGLFRDEVPVRLRVRQVEVALAAGLVAGQVGVLEDLLPVEAAVGVELQATVEETQAFEAQFELFRNFVHSFF